MDSRSLIGLIASVALVAGTALLVLRAIGFRSDLNRQDPTRRALFKMGGVLGIGFAGLAIRLTSIAVLDAKEVAEKTGESDEGEILSNPRIIAAQLDTKRGRILDRNGEVLAQSRKSGSVWSREFPVPEAAHVLGYFSPLRFGTAGLEHSRDGELTGNDPLTLSEALNSGILSRPPAGHDVRLTIDLDLQRLAASLLSGSTGSAILLDHRSGRILAMASSPAYDPTDLVAVRESDLKGVDAAWASLVADEDRPLLLRATSGLYPPGSTFKTLVASASIDAGFVSPDTVFTDDGSLTVDGRVIPEFNRPDDSQTEWTVREGIVWSLNVVFAQIGLQLGAKRLRSYADGFGIGIAIPFELPTEAGQISAQPDSLDAKPALAATSFGQGELLVTPLHMALVMAAIANAGVTMRPILVDAVLNESGETVSSTDTSRWRTPIRPETAATVMDLLYDSVTYGYASAAQIADLRVAGKTGTAESGREEPHGWFIGSAGVTDPVVTVAVCLDFGGEGGGLPLQIGRQLLDAAVSR